jgi:hypothetical protein
MLADRSAGLLHTAQEAWLAQHLLCCPTCLAEEEALRRVLDLLDSTRPLAPPAGMWGAIEARILSGRRPAPAAARPWYSLRPSLAAGAALAVAAALVVRHHVPPPPPVAALPRESIGYIERHARAVRTQPFADPVGLVSFATVTARSRSGGAPDW